MNHQCFWFKWDAFLFHEGLSGTCDRSLIQKSVSVIYGLTEALIFIYGLTEALSFIYFNPGLADELFKSRKNVGCLRFRTEVINYNGRPQEGFRKLMKMYDQLRTFTSKPA